MNRVVPIGVPYPPHEAFVPGNAGSNGENVVSGSGVVEAEAEGEGVEGVDVVADYPVAGVVFDYSISEFAFVDESEGLICRN